jgi:hypothetical protein
MSATITLPVELESLLAKKAAARGVNVEEFAVDVLNRAARRPTISEVFADVRADFVASGMTEEELGQLIEQALSEVRAERRDE